MTINNNRLALLSLTYCPYLGSSSIRRMEQGFPDLSDVFKTNKNELLKIGIKQNTVNKFYKWRSAFSDKNLLIDLERAGINFVSWHDVNYPSLLKEIFDPPPILFYRGKLISASPNQDNYALAIVGARQCTAYAEKVIKNILPGNLTKRITIISGLASGVDRLAHEHALNHQGRTIAVLGSGLNWQYLYPRSHRQLAEKIINSGGCILSEFPPNTPPNKINFPRRNRIISGLSKAILIVEAALKSGSLITARMALEQGREVLAVPGNIFWGKSMGANNLIQNGAKAILKTEDLLDSLNLEIEIEKQAGLENNYAKIKTLGTNENLVYSIIMTAYGRGDKITSEKIVSESKLDTSAINSTLTILELKSLIKEVGGNIEPC